MIKSSHVTLLFSSPYCALIIQQHLFAVKRKNKKTFSLLLFIAIAEIIQNHYETTDKNANRQ